MSGNRENFFYADESGAYVVGNTSFLAEPQNIRFAGMFRFLTAYEMMIPSTVVTPRPMLYPESPVEGFSSLAESVAEFISELI
jgi:hypothetical protein